MKQYFLLLAFCCLFTQMTMAQCTICEKNTLMYFACYKLNPDSTFSYQKIDGMGEQIGIGTYSAHKKGFTFRYDSLISPIIVKKKKDDSMDKIRIKCAYVLDSFPRLFNPVIYNNKLFFCDSMGIATIPNYSSGPILVHNYVDSIRIFPDQDRCNEYHLYTHSAGDKFIGKGTIQQLEKKGKAYRRKVRSTFNKKGTPSEEAWRYLYYHIKKI